MVSWRIRLGNRAKSGSGAPGPKSVPRCTTSTTSAKVFFSAVQPSKFFSSSSRGTFGFTHPTSVILIRPGWSLRSVRDWRLVRSELHLETHVDIYSPGIVVCDNVCNSVCNNVCNDVCSYVCINVCNDVWQSKLQAHLISKTPPPTSLSSFSLVV